MCSRASRARWRSSAVNVASGGCGATSSCEALRLSVMGSRAGAWCGCGTGGSGVPSTVRPDKASFRSTTACLFATHAFNPRGIAGSDTRGNFCRTFARAAFILRSPLSVSSAVGAARSSGVITLPASASDISSTFGRSSGGRKNA